MYIFKQRLIHTVASLTLLPLVLHAIFQNEKTFDTILFIIVGGLGILINTGIALTPPGTFNDEKEENDNSN